MSIRELTSVRSSAVQLGTTWLLELLELLEDCKTGVGGWLPD